ncbi:MAG TPA: APC family permease, partial [Thermoanaerobaculia bacterium]|nr:APC family permease [Thermoanaerobaculia bacterium]
FFAYAGFEGLAQTAGEVRDSTRSLPRIFLRGILITTIIYFLMSVVAFGVLPGQQLRASDAPMTAVASTYLAAGAAWFVTLGAIMAIATSVNATMLVPSRIAIMLADDGLAPRALASIWSRTATPVLGLTITLALSLVLLVSGQMGLVLNIAIFALVALYFLHSIALLVLPRANPELFASVTLRLPRGVQVIAGLLSVLSMGTLLVLMLRDLALIKLLAFWAAIGAVLYLVRRVTRRSAALRSSSPQ